MKTIVFSPLALSVFVSKMYRRARQNRLKHICLFVGIFITSFCYSASIDINACLQRAQTYKKKAIFDTAITVLTEGLKSEPDHADLLFELSNTYNWVNRFDEALALYKKLNLLIPNNIAILDNTAFTLRLLGQLDEALMYYNKSLTIDAHNKATLFNRGLVHLILGDFEKGLADYEYRYIPPLPPLLNLNDKPVWDGSDLQGKTILIHNAEQCFGDTFQFIRYAQHIKEKNGIVIAAVHTALVPIIKLCKYIDNVVSKDKAPPHFDVHAPIMSLPYILQTRLDSIPHECPYLFADHQLISHWKQQLATDNNFKIGICWHASEAQKSIPLQQLLPLCSIPNTTIYSLQQVDGTEQLTHMPHNVNIITFNDNFDDNHKRFMDTAAVIKNLDLVITVDTSIAHLAGGLGIKTWVVLPNPADWRWMNNCTDSPWYPTMHLFRQSTPGDWETVVQTITQELQKLITERK